MNYPLIPEAKQAIVAKALQAAFGMTTIDRIEKLTRGYSSALVYRIQVQERDYVLRLIMRVDELNNPARQFTCMNTAAEAEVAPPVRYANAEDALSITDFIQSVPLPRRAEVTEDFLYAVIDAIKAIHNTGSFPELVNYLDGIDKFIQQFQESGILPESATEEHLRHYAEIQRVYPRHDPDRVSSHNDMNPNNMLFTGKKLWLVDWETAFRNDRYADLSNAATYFVSNEVQEEVYLRAYFGETLDDYKRARFFLMQQVCHMFYAMAFLYLASVQRKPDSVHIDSMETPRLLEFHTQENVDAALMGSYEGQLLYGKIRLNEALHNMKTPRFAEAIRQVGAGPTADPSLVAPTLS